MASMNISLPDQMKLQKLREALIKGGTPLNNPPRSKEAKNKDVIRPYQGGAVLVRRNPLMLKRLPVLILKR